MKKTPTNIICDMSALSLSSKILENVKDRLVYEVSREEFMDLQAYISKIGHQTNQPKTVKEIRILGIRVRERS